MRFRGIRGAVTVEANTELSILSATQELLSEMLRANEIDPDEIAGVLFTMTVDLNAAFPAEAGRRLPGWSRVPLMDAQEVPGPAHCRAACGFSCSSTPRGPRTKFSTST